MSRRLRTVLALALVAAPLGLAGPAPASAFGLSCDSPYYCITFTMELFGNGSGSVITVDADGVPDGRVSCTEVNGVTTATSVCSARYRGLIGSNIYVRFTASPATGSCLQDGAFGPCITTAKTQTWQSQYDFAQGAEFHLLPEHVSVTTTGEGTGRATSSPTGIDCPPTCSADFPYGLLLTLTATPDAGAAFKAWTGACAGQGPICKLKPKGAVSTNAVFGLAAAPTAPPTAAP
ncbi:MAG TPA: hypothetical protein VFP19_00750, partial [Candidatus Limnocylindrales bacterium]|nr:hypothetical protein [Candidatus Limnocylindrales bacterium]